MERIRKQDEERRVLRGMPSRMGECLFQLGMLVVHRCKMAVTTTNNATLFVELVMVV